MEPAASVDYLVDKLLKPAKQFQAVPEVRRQHQHVPSTRRRTSSMALSHIGDAKMTGEPDLPWARRCINVKARLLAVYRDRGVSRQQYLRAFQIGQR